MSVHSHECDGSCNPQVKNEDIVPGLRAWLERRRKRQEAEAAERAAQGLPPKSAHDDHCDGC